MQYYQINRVLQESDMATIDQFWSTNQIPEISLFIPEHNLKFRVYFIYFFYQSAIQRCERLIEQIEEKVKEKQRAITRYESKPFQLSLLIITFYTMILTFFFNMRKIFWF